MKGIVITSLMMLILVSFSLGEKLKDDYKQPLKWLVTTGGPRLRAKRDLTCAVRGHASCNASCMMRGRASGACAWDEVTAAYNCACAEERRGIRCNVGGDNTCKYTCKVIGHTGGTCDEEYNCVCSGERVRTVKTLFARESISLVFSGLMRLVRRVK